MARSRSHASVIGSGPNGLAAAIRLARAGVPVTVFEAQPDIGGGMRSRELTLPGFVHDLCSAVHPLALASPFLTTLPLDGFGLRWIQPDLPVAHPFDDGTAAILDRSLARTAAALGPDGAAWTALFAPLVHAAPWLMPALLGPVRVGPDPLALARFGASGLLPAATLARRAFRTERARGLFAGLAAHSFLRMEDPLSSAFGLLLGMLGHAVGWPLAEGGSQRLADAMAGYLRSLGGEILPGAPVRSLDGLPPSGAVLFDTDPGQLAAIAGDRLPAGFRRRLEAHEYGPGAFKIDYALDGPVPWTAPECRRAGTVHLGATLEEIARSERTVLDGGHPDRPYVLVVQPTPFDPSRAPAARHVLWAYCHVPHASTVDMTSRIEAQVERFAPGFRDLVLARHVTTPAEFERTNANEVGGAINGGVQTLATTLRQALAFPSPYDTPDPEIYLCSASTPPGGGVHGMSGYHAAGRALRRAPLAKGGSR